MNADFCVRFRLAVELEGRRHCGLRSVAGDALREITDANADGVGEGGVAIDISAEDELARLTGMTPSDTGAELIGRVTTPLHLPPPSEVERPSRTPASMRLAWEGIRNGRPTKLLSGLVPEGGVSSSSIAARVRQIHPEFWPETPTWITAVELASGDRTVFGRSDDRIHLSAAVQASSSIPGYFSPVSLGGRQFVDGGIHSASNADLVAGLFFDLVIISSTLSVEGRESPLAKARDLNRAWHNRVLGEEVERVRAAGSEVLVLQPTEEDLEVGGGDNMDRARVRDYARQVRSSVRAQLSRPGSEAQLALLERAAENSSTID